MLSRIDPNRDMREDSVILKDGDEIDIAWDWEDDDMDPRNDFELRVFKIRFDDEPWQEIEGEQKQIEFFQEKTTGNLLFAYCESLACSIPKADKWTNC